MKLFLSSIHPANKEALLSLLDNSRGHSVVIVPSGWDIYPKERKEAELDHLVSTFQGYGMTTSLLDLTTASKQSVTEHLSDKALVWVMAGNTFYLNYYLHKSGFSEVVTDFLEKGLVYGGESAGAVVAGKTLHGVEKVDDFNESPEIIWEGLSLTQGGILPHWGWGKYQAAMSAAKFEMEKFAPVTTLANDQAAIFIDGKRTIIENTTSSRR